MSWGQGKKTLSADVAHTGTRSLRVTRRSQQWEGPFFVFAGADATMGFKGTVRNGYRYDYTAWVRLGGDKASGNVEWSFNTTDDTGSHYTTSAAVAATTTDWVEVKGSCMPSVTGTLTNASLSMSGAPTGADIYIDDVTVTATKLTD
jgi:hypothetical protein